MTIQLDREHITFNTPSGEYVYCGVPDELAQNVDEIMTWVESYRTPQQEAKDAVLEAAFDSGTLEAKSLVALAKPWVPGEKVVPGDVRSHDEMAYKATKEHTTEAVKETLDETGYWIAYKQKKKEE